MSNCPSALELEAYLDVGTEVGIGPHVRACPTCTARLKELQDDREFLQGLREAAPSNTQNTPVSHDAPDGYDLVRVIGRGGQAVVYEAVQRSTRRRVALKVVRLGTRDVVRRRRRFEREAELVSSLRHPAIVTVFDSGITPEGDPYLVMEFIEGEPLAFRPDASLRERLSEFRQVCAAVRYAHQHGVVHRDLKPSNILIDSSGQPRVLDFGLATTVEARDTLTLTRSGEFLGTPIYAAPEQLQGAAQTPDVRTDVYALGVLLYQQLTGEHPFVPGSALADIVTGIIEKDPARPSSRIRGLNHEIDTIVLKALAKEPARRYPSVDALDGDIDRYLRGEPIEAKRDSTWYTLRKTARRHRLAVCSAAGFVLLLLAFGITMSLLYRSARDTSRALAETLASRDMDRGVELVRADDLDSAEGLLWDAYLRWVREDDDVTDWRDGPLLRRRAHWGLWELYQRQPCIRTIQLSNDRPWCLQPTGDGEVFVVDDGFTLYRWQPRVGTYQTQQLPRRDASLRCVRIAQAPHRAVIGYRDGLHVIPLDQPQAAVFYPAPAEPIVTSWSEVVYPDGARQIASSHEDGSVRCWDIDTGALGDPMHLQDTAINILSFASNGGVWAHASDPSAFRVGNLFTPQPVTTQRRVSPNWLSVSGDGRLLAHAGRIWKTQTNDPPILLEDQPRAQADSFSFSQQGHFLLGRGNTTPIWDSSTGELIRVLTTRDANLSALQDSSGLASTAHMRGLIRAWDIDLQQGQAVFEVGGTTHEIAFAPDDRTLLVCGSTDKRPFLYEVDLQERTMRPFEVGTERRTFSGLAWQDQNSFFSADHAGRVLHWQRMPDGWSHDVVARVEIPINQLLLDQDGMLSLACNDGSIRRGPAGGTLTTVSQQESRIAAIAPAPLGGLVAGGRSGGVRSWNTELPPSLPGPPTIVRAIATLQKPDRIAAAGDDQTIRVWDGTGQLLYERANGARVFALALSADGTLLASGDVSGAVRLWDLPSGTLLAELLGHQHMVFTLRFSSDVRYLASGASDGTVRVWSLTHFDRHIRGNLAYQRSLRD